MGKGRGHLHAKRNELVEVEGLTCSQEAVASVNMGSGEPQPPGRRPPHGQELYPMCLCCSNT
jgi:hypothetical protein